MDARLGIALAFLTVVACSGASSSELFDPAVDRSATLPAPDGPDRAAAEAPPPPTSPTAPSATTKPGENAKEEPPKPDPVCTAEAEPNDTRLTATAFPTSLCGKLSPEDSVDFWEWKAPANATKMRITHSESDGRVSYKVLVGELVIPIEQLDAWPIFEGTTYLIRAALPLESDASPSYRVEIRAE
jgi:hypothetical protein